MTAEAAMKILIALTFAFLFCRGRGYSELASVAGAVIFGFSRLPHAGCTSRTSPRRVSLPAVLCI